MNKLVVGVGAVVILGALYFGAIYANTNPAEVVVQSAITLDRDSHDFGDIDIFGGKVNTEYILKNEGTEDVKIVSAVTSCMCTEGEIGGLRFGMHESRGGSVTIPAGDEKILTAIYDPLAHGPSGTGPVKRELFLKTNSEITPDIKVQFRGNVVKGQ